MNKLRFFHTLINTFIILFLVSGCGSLSQTRYQEPESSNIATIHNYKKTSHYNKRAWEQYTLDSIDNMSVYPASTYRDPENITDYRFDESEATTRVPIGEHSLTIAVRFHRGQQSGPFVSKIPIKLTAEANRQYRLNGEVSGKQVNVWVEHYGTGERVSDINSGEYVCTGCGKFIPVFIPIR